MTIDSLFILIRTNLACLRDRAGSALVEFALVAPVFLALVMGSLEMGYQLYMRNLLEGLMSKAARDMTLESAGDATVRSALDESVKNRIREIHNGANITFKREAFYDFSQVRRRHEPFSDANYNGECDPGEIYADLKPNGRFDKNGFRAGWGAAEEAIVYQAKLSYPRLFPVGALLGLSSTATVETKKLLKIQPFAAKTEYVVRTC